MKIRCDITGHRFGKLTAIKPTKIISKRSYWLFQCDCGNFRETMAQNVKSGDAFQCDDCNRKARSERSIRHGKSNTRLHHIWVGMRMRCSNPRDTSYHNYGGRGIRVCQEWREFEAFDQWAVENGYADSLQIDRMDNDGPYAPWNCRWVPAQVNCQNKRKTVFCTFKGERLCLSEVARRSGVHVNTLRHRLRRGLSIEESTALEPNTWSTRRLLQSQPR